jgi:hypothetical protein
MTVTDLSDILEAALDELSQVDQDGPVTVKGGTNLVISVDRTTDPASVLIEITD